jgi:hypothetical protein
MPWLCLVVEILLSVYLVHNVLLIGLHDNITLFSTDENSLPMSCPDDVCLQKEGRKFLLGEQQVEYGSLAPSSQET